jgi:hypothetical protein
VILPYPPSFPQTFETRRVVKPSDESAVRKGWECPRCGTVWSPDSSSCTCKPRGANKSECAPYDEGIRGITEPFTGAP